MCFAKPLGITPIGSKIQQCRTFFPASGVLLSLEENQKRGFAYPRFRREIKAGNARPLCAVAHNSGLKRYTPLRSLTPLKRSPLKRRSAKAAAKARQWSAVTREAMRLSGGRCVVGLPGCLGRATEGHHRLSRAQGGSYDLLNVVPVCHACHVHITCNPAWAYAAGWLIHRFGGTNA